MKSLDRRTFLRGAAGVAVGLPALEIMLNGNGDAYATGAPVVPRFLVCFAGCSLGADFDPVPNSFIPDQVGPNYDLKIGTQPLAGHGNIKDKISIGAGSVIGAGAIVVSDLPPNVTAVGVPARITKQNEVLF